MSGNTLHMAIRAAVVALLQAAPTLTGSDIIANRRRPMPREVNTRVYVYLEDSMATRGEIHGAPFDWATRIRVECVARDVAGIPADIGSDALQAAVYAVLQANTGLGGLSQDIEPKALAWTEDEADATVSACQAIYSVTHRTQGDVITA